MDYGSLGESLNEHVKHSYNPFTGRRIRNMGITLDGACAVLQGVQACMR